MKLAITAIMMMLTASISFCQESADFRKKNFNLKQGLAIQGYDPVAYFKQQKAVKGSEAFTSVDQGVTYRFSNAANKADFDKNPSAFEPRYGGWCAYAMGANGERVSVDPGTFKIVDNKLYLFYNRFFNNTLKSWNKDEGTLKKQADQHWSSMVH